MTPPRVERPSGLRNFQLWGFCQVGVLVPAVSVNSRWRACFGDLPTSAIERLPCCILVHVFTPQPEIIAKLIPKTLFHVTEMRFSKEIIPKQVFRVIL